MSYPYPDLPVGNTDATPAGSAGGGVANYHADQLHNAVNAAVNALKAVLGAQPQGIAASVQARLDALDAALTAASAPAGAKVAVMRGGGRNIFVQTAPPTAEFVNDLWFDTDA